MEKRNNRNIVKEYVLGNGNLGIQAGVVEYATGNREVFIDLGELDNSYDIGSEPDEDFKEFTRLLIKSESALDVLQKAIDQCRNNLNYGK